MRVRAQYIIVRGALLFACLAFASVAILSSIDTTEAACAKVSMDIVQGLTMERVAFDAKLVITNNMPERAITGVRVEIEIRDAEGNDRASEFYIAHPTYRNITDVSGNGTVGAGLQAEVHWLIIPSPGAGGQKAEGTAFWVGATLSYEIENVPENIVVNPDRIIVRPEAELVLDYFTPYKVLGDNPFTSDVEPSVPYPLAVRVLNDGYGQAWSLNIESARPEITANTQGLLVDFQILGSSVNDAPHSPELTLAIGNVESKGVAMAYWEMISSLSGMFTKFDVSFKHADDLGGKLTSLIRATNAHYFVHRVMVDLPGRDRILDILADTDRDPASLPDKVFESEFPGNSTLAADTVSPVAVVNVVSVSGRPTPENQEVEVVLGPSGAGWVYARMREPGAGKLDILRVVRSDGMELDVNNVWVAESFEVTGSGTLSKSYWLHIFDFRGSITAPNTYTVVYRKPEVDILPPVTEVHLNGPSIGADPVFITPQTIISYTAEDNDGGSGVDAMLSRVVGESEDFLPAYPFALAQPGYHAVDYYSVDRAGNAEDSRQMEVWVDTVPPEIGDFIAEPPVFSPGAPWGVASVGSVVFSSVADDATGYLPAAIEISRGETFDSSQVVRRYEFEMVPGVVSEIGWSGEDETGSIVPSSTYTARLSVGDGLGDSVGHTSTADIRVRVDEWFNGVPVDAHPSTEQTNPDMSGSIVVWQDMRNGNWDIYMKDLAVDGQAVAVTTLPSEQTLPAIDDRVVVWQDRRSGNWDIYGYALDSMDGFAVSVGDGNQTRPVVDLPWVAWQDDSAGNYDIYARNLDTGQTIRITTHERDQMNPAIAGNMVVWEDYRHGLPEIYEYDLLTGVQTRKTYDLYAQTEPASFEGLTVWTDRRNGQRDIYAGGSELSENRITFDGLDHWQPDILNTVVVYTITMPNSTDTNLAFFDMATLNGARLTADPSRQESPAVGSGKLAWQDNRSGTFQIYVADFQVASMPIVVMLKPGFNLVAIGDLLAGSYGSAAALTASYAGLLNALSYNSMNVLMLDTSIGDSVPLSKGMGLGIYASREVRLAVSEAGETAAYTLMPGTNYIGMLSVRPGYSAYRVLESLGLGNVQSIRKFDSTLGSWITAAVDDSGGQPVAVGRDFIIRPGEGLVLTMKHRVDGWRP